MDVSDEISDIFVGLNIKYKLVRERDKENNVPENSSTEEKFSDGVNGAEQNVTKDENNDNGNLNNVNIQQTEHTENTGKQTKNENKSAAQTPPLPQRNISPKS